MVLPVVRLTPSARHPKVLLVSRAIQARRAGARSTENHPTAKVVRLAPQRKRRLARQRRSTQAAISGHTDPRLAWYLGLGLMAVIEVIEWPVALVLAVGHELTYRARTRALKELARGIEAAG